jgi:hypothetical protein
MEPEEERIVVTETVQARSEEGFDINLPDTDNLFEALKNAEMRKALIAQWMEAYRPSWPGSRRPSALSERLLQAQTDIGAALGCVKIAGLLKEIDGWTGFTRDFSYQRRVSWWSVNWKPRLSFLCSTARPLCCNTVRFLKRAPLKPHGPGPPGAESGQRLKPASGSRSWCT